MDGATDPGASIEESLWSRLIGDGRPLLVVVAVALMFAGAFAIFLAARGEFLPHDEAFLGMQADELCQFADCRIVDFMIHDRAAFGGALLALGILYLWAIVFPLGDGQGWAWWLIVVTGIAGMATFLTYLGYGYLDSWHGWGTLALLPFAIVGSALTRRHVRDSSITTLWRSDWLSSVPEPRRRGWQLVLVGGLGMVGVGTVILGVGIDAIFVGEDLTFIGLSRDQIDAINPDLVSVIAHDRASFGGAILIGGLLGVGATLHAAGHRSLWQALAIAGVCSFGVAIVVHYLVGYTDQVHLAPSYVGAILLTTGLLMARRPTHSPASGP